MVKWNKLKKGCVLMNGKGEFLLKIKTFRSLTYIRIESKVNEFLKDETIEIIDVKFSTTIFDYGVMVLYKDKK